MLAVLFLSGFYVAPGFAASSCYEEAAKNPVFQAFNHCDQLRVIQDPVHAAKLISELESLGYCKLTAEDAEPGKLKTLCEDPAGAVCWGRQRILDSECELVLEKSSKVSFNPAYVAKRCKIAEKVGVFLDSHRGECPKSQSPEVCTDHLKIKYRTRILRIERELVYDSATLRYLRGAFDRVLRKYLMIVRASKRIPQARKGLLLRKLQETKLAIPAANGDDADCFNTGAAGPDSDIYNCDIYGDEKDREVYFCIGAVAMLDRTNEYDLLETIAHEISHSIDPCALESAAWESGKADLEITEKTFPGLEKCLRGGTDCSTSLLQCNTRQGIEDFCSGDESVECKKKAKATPHCSMGGDGTTDSSKYSGPVDQTEESFADFLGAEVTARIMQDDKRQGLLDETGRVDALTALAADYVKADGVCRPRDTNNRHPSGPIRVDRNMMSSRAFREAVCYPGAPPPGRSFAGVSCEGF